ncbi:alcohol dehydrogenase [Paramyrothecium foliicola]|nr:alcohol dehydrogenase [Paramyrothecium foliicola]
MKEALISQGPRVNIVDSPKPVPQRGQILVRVVVAGSNPKDIKSTIWLPPSNLGDDIAGYVETLGEDVTEFHVNDRVAAFHEMFTPHGAFAEYAIVWAYTAFHLPNNISFEEAATVPLAAMTAALGLYKDLRLPPPWSTDEDRPETSPLVIYGAGAAVGAFAVQLAAKSGVHPLICVAGQSKTYVETLIDRSKGDVVIDYRCGIETVKHEIKKALNGKKLFHAFDAVAENGNDRIIGSFLDPLQGRFTMTLPKDKVIIPKEPGVVLPVEFVLPPLEGVPEGVQAFWTAVGSVHNASKQFGYVYFRYLALGLKEGWFRPHPHEVIPGGLNGLEVGLKKLLDGKAHAVKYVYQIATKPT